MGATFSRVKNWTTEILTNSDLNTEIDNILNNLGPSGVDDYSTNTSQMRTQTAPGEVGSESLATSLAGELERLRYVIQRIIGTDVDYWYEAPTSSITDMVAALGAGLPSYRIVSGKTTGNSSQLLALVPNGVSASVTLSASSTPFVYYIGGTQYSITANVTLTGLSLAPATNNTCSLNETAAAGQSWTKFLGQYGTTLEVDGMNSSVAAAVGSIAGFKSGNEYFIAYVNSTLSLTNAWRGAFFNETPSNIPAVGLSNNAEIKLMRLAWIFANTNSSLAVTYNNPTIDATQPTSPTTGDYWFDLGTTAWKTYNSTTWVAANAILMGITMQNTVACVAARTLDPFKAYDELNTLTLKQKSATVLEAADMFSEVNVYGNTNRFLTSRPQWDIASELESGVTEAANTIYYAYMKENGTTVLSDKHPLSRRDLGGLYHPHEAWRCLGSTVNNNSQDFETNVKSFYGKFDDKFLMGNPLAYDATNPNATGSTVIPAIFSGLFVEDYNTASATWGGGAAAWGDVTSISLKPGVYSLTGVIGHSSSGATISSVQFGISTTNTTNFSDAKAGVNHFTGVRAADSAQIINLVTPEWWVVVTATQSYFLKLFVADVAGTSHVNYYRLAARRIDSPTGMPL